MSDIWNVDSLKEYIDRRFDDSDKAIQAALVAQEKAIIKAENAAERRFDLLNELREGVATKDQLEALERVVGDIKDRFNLSDGQIKGSQLSKGNFYAALGAGIAVLGLIVVVMNLIAKG